MFLLLFLISIINFLTGSSGEQNPLPKMFIKVEGTLYLKRQIVILYYTGTVLYHFIFILIMYAFLQRLKILNKICVLYSQFTVNMTFFRILILQRRSLSYTAVRKLSRVRKPSLFRKKILSLQAPLNMGIHSGKM